MQMESGETPQELVDELSNLHEIEVSSLSVPLVEHITSLTSNYFCPYSSKQTGSTRKTQVFVCKLRKMNHGTECPSFFEYIISNGFIYRSNANFKHNHPVSKHFFYMNAQQITSNDRKYIKDATYYGASPGHIRVQLDNPVPASTLYYIRKDAQESKLKKSLDAFWRILIYGKNGMSQ